MAAGGSEVMARPVSRCLPILADTSAFPRRAPEGEGLSKANLIARLAPPDDVRR